MLNIKKTFYSPDAGGASGAAAPTATNDDLFEVVEGSDAESEQPIEGVTAVNTPDSEGEPLEANATADDEPKAESFDALMKRIQTDYKKEYQAHFNAAFNKRHKEHKQLEETVTNLKAERESIQPLVRALAARHGVNPEDIKALVEAVDKDNSYFEKEAYEKGFGTPEAYREHLKTTEELNRLRESERERTQTDEDNRHREQLLRGWLDESRSLQKEVAGFDFKAEWNSNQQFRYLLNSGFSVKDAYKMTHVDEYVKAAEKRAQESVVREVAANRARPIENGVDAHAAVRVKKSISDMTLADTDRIIQEAKRGKKISF